MKKLFCAVFAVMMAFSAGGCGYTQNVKMPNDIKKLAVPTFTNTIKARQIFTYEAGLEVKITNAIRDRILFDGNVKLTEPDQADAVLIGKLIRFEQEPIGYNSLEQVDRYRLYIATDLTLKDLRTNQIIWNEPNFVGEIIYANGGSSGISQAEATNQIITKLARDIIDRMVEDW